MDSFVVTIDRKRWADMRRNSRLGLIGSVLIGLGGGAWLILAALIGENTTSVVPGVLLVMLGLAAGLSFRAKKDVAIDETGSPVLFTLDREGLHMDGADGARLDRPWGAFQLNWLHKSASYLELSSEGIPTQEWPVIVTDLRRPSLAEAVTELSSGRSSLGSGHRAPRSEAS